MSLEDTMGTVFSRLALLIVLALGLAALPARAEESAGGDEQALRSVITGQMQAFQRDDGATAYSYASPMIRDLFPTVDGFMTMVRSGYQPVYRPQSVTFGQLKATDGGYLQQVFITGPDGRNWVALYSMQRQPDGSWLINGCSLIEDNSPAI
jgi:hypothetical protein